MILIFFLVPPTRIIQDIILSELCKIRPDNENSMLCVDGFTKAKVDQFREALTIIKNFSIEHNLKTNLHEGMEHGITGNGTNKENKVKEENEFNELRRIPLEEPVTELVYAAHKNGAGIEQIAHEMNILRKTVCIHLAKAIEHGYPVDCSKLGVTFGDVVKTGTAIKQKFNSKIGKFRLNRW